MILVRRQFFFGFVPVKTKKPGGQQNEECEELFHTISNEDLESQVFQRSVRLIQCAFRLI